MNLAPKIPFFNLLSEESQKKFVAALEIKKIPAGQLIFREGDSCTHLTVVVSGQIRIFRTTSCGKEVTFHLVNSGELCVLGLNSIMTNKPYIASAEAASDIALASIPAQVFKELISLESKLSLFVIEYLSANLRSLMDKMLELSLLKVDQRIAQFLIDFDMPKVRLNQEAIALYLNTSREVVSRTLSRFERESIITNHRGLVEITNPNALKKIAELNM